MLTNMTAKIILLVLSVVATVSADGTSHTSVAKAGESQYTYDIVHSYPGHWSGNSYPHGYGGLGSIQSTGQTVGNYGYSGLTGYRSYGIANGYGHGSLTGYPTTGYTQHGVANIGYHGYSMPYSPNGITYNHNSIPYSHGGIIYGHGSSYSGFPYSHGGLNYNHGTDYVTVSPYTYGSFGSAQPYSHNNGYGHGSYAGYGYGGHLTGTVYGYH